MCEVVQACFDAPFVPTALFQRFCYFGTSAWRISIQAPLFSLLLMIRPRVSGALIITI